MKVVQEIQPFVAEKVGQIDSILNEELDKIGPIVDERHLHKLVELVLLERLFASKYVTFGYVDYVPFEGQLQVFVRVFLMRSKASTKQILTIENQLKHN